MNLNDLTNDLKVENADEVLGGWWCWFLKCFDCTSSSSSSCSTEEPDGSNNGGSGD